MKMGLSRKFSLIIAVLAILFLIARFVPSRLLFGSNFVINDMGDDLSLSWEDTSTADKYLRLIVERPLFDLSRKPPQAEVQPAQQASPAPRIAEPVLLGMMVNRQGVAIAYLRFDGEEESVKVKAGDTHNRWEINSIENDQVTLIYGEKRFVLDMTTAGASNSR